MKENEKEFLAALSQYGYPLLGTELKMDTNQLLSKLVEKKDTRLLEGFPVVLANLLSNETSKFEFKKASNLVNPSKKQLFLFLYKVSCQLFGLYHLEFPRLNQKAMLQDEKLKNDLANDHPLKFGNTVLDSKRLKETFLNYVVNRKNLQGETKEERAKLKEEFRQEYYLSLLLSPTQKDLLFKKLRGEAFTKTEREYYSRVVKKKLQALADPDLHRLAQKALQSN